ncbi:hypothetical protein [Haloplanus natans]|uniref:hypothetical protein n=1 Tax=Haloplanus natans TaxID=376171 RepID=UPI0006778EB9|nr:hypothetical protein [Haloplanus natans]
MKRILLAGLAVIACIGLLSAPAAANHQETTATPSNGSGDQSGEDDEPIIDFSGVVEAINDLIEDFEKFTGSWDQTLKDILIAVLFHPFKLLAQQLLNALSTILMHTPDVHPNPAIEQVHSRVLLVTYLLSGLGLTAAGLLYITGPLLGVSYNEVRMIIPRLLAALIFSTVSLPLLQYAVELSNALVYAFSPDQLWMSLTQLAGLSTGLVLAWVVNAALLLVVVVMFIIRNVYLMFVAAISPLLALAWSVPKAKRYADSFIAGWWTALAMAPLDMLVLKFSFAMLQGNGASITASISNWILGVGAFSLLILVPYQLYGASQAAIGQAYVVSQGIKSRAKQAYRIQQGRGTGGETDFDLSNDEARRLKSYRRKKRRQSSDNGFRSNWGGGD